MKMTKTQTWTAEEIIQDLKKRLIRAYVAHAETIDKMRSTNSVRAKHEYLQKSAQVNELQDLVYHYAGQGAVHEAMNEARQKAKQQGYTMGRWSE